LKAARSVNPLRIFAQDDCELLWIIPWTLIIAKQLAFKRAQFLQPGPKMQAGIFRSTRQEEVFQKQLKEWQMCSCFEFMESP